MDVSDYAACDATALAELIAARQVSAAEVRQAALQAIEQVEPELNAVVSGPFEDATAGEGPFAGVPFGVKDTLWERGRPYDFGSRLLEGQIAALDSTIAVRFRAAGLLSLVRTATPEFGGNFDTAPVLRGPTRNPWDPTRSPGGSSGGSAALVAARALPIAHGNDGAGSIRVPAAWCGLVGLKPSRGRTPIGPLVGEAPGGLPHEFALSRTVRDAAGLLDAVCGPAPGDHYYVTRPARPLATRLGEDPCRLRIAMHTRSYWGHETGGEQREAVERVARCLEGLGHSVEEEPPPVDAEAFRALHLVVWPWLIATIATALAAMAGRVASAESVETATLACIRRARKTGALDISTAESIRNAESRQLGAFLDRFDLLLSPTTPSGPPLAGVPAHDDAAYADVERWIDDFYAVSPYTPIANSTGQPSISLPLGATEDGLPAGVMLTAQTLREDVLLQVAAQLEHAMPWIDRRPKVSAE